MASDRRCHVISFSGGVGGRENACQDPPIPHLLNICVLRMWSNANFWSIMKPVLKFMTCILTKRQEGPGKLPPSLLRKIRPFRPQRATRCDIFGLKEPLFGEGPSRGSNRNNFVLRLKNPGPPAALSKILKNTCRVSSVRSKLVRTPKFGSSVWQHEIEEEMGQRWVANWPQSCLKEPLSGGPWTDFGRERATFRRRKSQNSGLKEPLFWSRPGWSFPGPRQES
ncbi:hypothetical protein R3P38DRAFT_3601006 [Favolaschia claudopus]|uniref:Uncharacterized protein n=1 Tax=Favolaschia claudopus TaxID=2862362 RepID=A0AAW0ADH1_9AGAR